MSAGPSPIRILAVDDHPLVRQGIAGLIGVQPDMVLVGEASTGRDAYPRIPQSSARRHANGLADAGDERP